MTAVTANLNEVQIAATPALRYERVARMNCHRSRRSPVQGQPMLCVLASPRVLCRTFIAAAALLLSSCEAAPERQQMPPPVVQEAPVAVGDSAQAQFSAVKWPAAISGPSVIGTYARGCLARAEALPLDGPHWEVMRTSRNRYWGHPTLVSFIERLAERQSKSGLPGLLVGDLGQPRGGPSPTGHASHQIGLDADIWLMPMPSRRYADTERETTPAPSMLKPGTIEVDRKLFTRVQIELIKHAAQFTEVERIFVNPGIKKALCRSAGRDRAWLSKIRPWRGHDDHIHVRLRCPAGETMCKAQTPPPSGDGCGAELTSWLTSTDWRKPGPEPRMEPIPMSALPATCTQVVRAPSVSQTAVNR
ncbi:MAG: penicillin-insensitive murein endopeptidase [Alphaproteobacteria bacterium]|nr:penicillin-insensitive murein endopeptidase [Alphaproteobacteria bacterium]